jgi:hypothetical protein
MTRTFGTYLTFGFVDFNEFQNSMYCGTQDKYLLFRFTAVRAKIFK